MNRTRYLLAKKFGWCWSDFKTLAAHYVNAYTVAIQKDKESGGGIGDPRATYSAMEKAGML
jgi:hypothetical protein